VPKFLKVKKKFLPLKTSQQRFSLPHQHQATGKSGQNVQKMEATQLASCWHH
jgi:hypothetical protein